MINKRFAAINSLEYNAYNAKPITTFYGHLTLRTSYDGGRNIQTGSMRIGTTEIHPRKALSLKINN